MTVTQFLASENPIDYLSIGIPLFVNNRQLLTGPERSQKSQLSFLAVALREIRANPKIGKRKIEAIAKASGAGVPRRENQERIVRLAKILTRQASVEITIVCSVSSKIWAFTVQAEERVSIVVLLAFAIARADDEIACTITKASIHNQE